MGSTLETVQTKGSEYIFPFIITTNVYYIDIPMFEMCY